MITYWRLVTPVSRHQTKYCIDSSDRISMMTWEGSQSAHRIPSIDWWMAVTYSTVWQTDRWTSYCNRNVCNFCIALCSSWEIAWLIVSLDRWKETTASLSYLIFITLNACWIFMVPHSRSLTSSWAWSRYTVSIVTWDGSHSVHWVSCTHHIFTVIHLPIYWLTQSGTCD